MEKERLQKEREGCPIPKTRKVWKDEIEDEKLRLTVHDGILGHTTIEQLIRFWPAGLSQTGSITMHSWN